MDCVNKEEQEIPEQGVKASFLHTGEKRGFCWAQKRGHTGEKEVFRLVQKGRTILWRGEGGGETSL